MSSSMTDSLTDDDVFLGFWTNWAYGPIRGATLTLTRRDAGFLTAFLALFVGAAGASLWRIACFAIHYALSSEAEKDGIYHQRQAILRNAADGMSALRSLLRMNWAWRKHRDAKPYRRILPLITFTVAIVGGLMLAVIFSSEISSAMGNEVLLSGSNCGIRTVNGVDTTSYYGTVIPYMVQRTVSSASYALGCYRNGFTAQNCPTFVQKSLPWTSRRDAGCPFPGLDKICRSNSTNLRIDTGYINSNSHLGINSPREYQFLYRNVVECAPLNTEGYSENATVSRGQDENGGQRHVMKYYYGPRIDDVPDPATGQTTYQYPADPVGGINYYNGIPNSAASDYTVRVHWAYTRVNGSVFDGLSSFLPSSDLVRVGADISLAFLSVNDIRFAGPSNDPWYSAHVPSSLSGVRTWGLSGNVSLYTRDDPVRVLGCTSQYQYCNPNLEPEKRCTPLSGIMELDLLAQELWQTEKQKAMFNWTSSVILQNSMAFQEVLIDLGISTLTARYGLSGGMQGSLPDHQWQLDVEHWFTTALADLQRTVVEHATGPLDTAINAWLQRPETPEERLLCRSQRIRNDAFTSFSTVGLVILLGVGGLLISTSFMLDYLVPWIQSRMDLTRYKRLEWMTNETLQLQRLAHEALGCGTWSTTSEMLPTTAPGERLAIVDTSDPDHPKLASPTTKVNTTAEEWDYYKNSAVEIIEWVTSRG